MEKESTEMIKRYDKYENIAFEIKMKRKKIVRYIAKIKRKELGKKQNSKTRNRNKIQNK